MSLNFYAYLLYFSTTFVVFKATTLYLPTSAGYAQLPDIFSRVLVNEFYFNLYYYFWTSFWYLPVFFLGLLITYSVLERLSLSTYTHLWLLPTLLTLLTECCDYAVLSQGMHCSTLIPHEFNILLLNSVNKYHPLLLYLVVLIILTQTRGLVAVLKTSDGLQQVYHFLEPLTVRSIQRSAYHALFLIFFTLFLGSWWAVQEGSWGGWWNWDPSEVFGLLLGVYTVRWFHTRGLFWSTSSLSSLLQAYTLGLIILYTFIQINFDLVSHNFGTRIDQFVEPVYFLLLVFTSAVYLLLKLSGTGLRALINNLVFKQSFTIFGTRQLIVVRYFNTACFLLLAYMSFAILLNDFLWKTVTVNVGNTLYKHVTVLTILLFSTTLYFWRVSRSTLLALVCTLLSGTWSLTALLIGTRNSANPVWLLHLLLYIFLFTCVCNYLNVTNVWQLLLSQQLNSSKNLNVLHTPNTIGVNSIFLETTTQSLSGSVVVDGFWNIVYLDTSPESRTFLHCATVDNAQQSLSVGNLLFSFMVTSYDSTLLLLTFVFTTLVYTLCCAAYRKLLIVF